MCFHFFVLTDKRSAEMQLFSRVISKIERRLFGSTEITTQAWKWRPIKTLPCAGKCKTLESGGKWRNTVTGRKCNNVHENYMYTLKFFSLQASAYIFCPVVPIADSMTWRPAIWWPQTLSIFRTACYPPLKKPEGFWWINHWFTNSSVFSCVLTTIYKQIRWLYDDGNSVHIVLMFVYIFTVMTPNGLFFCDNVYSTPFSVTHV